MVRTTRQKKSKEIEDLTQSTRPKRHIQNTLSNKNSIHVLLKCTWYIFQDRPHLRPQIKSQQILKDIVQVKKQ